MCKFYISALVDIIVEWKLILFIHTRDMWPVTFRTVFRAVGSLAFQESTVYFWYSLLESILQNIRSTLYKERNDSSQNNPHLWQEISDIWSQKEAYMQVGLNRLLQPQGSPTVLTKILHFFLDFIHIICFSVSQTRPCPWTPFLMSPVSSSLYTELRDYVQFLCTYTRDVRIYIVELHTCVLQTRENSFYRLQNV